MQRQIFCPLTEVLSFKGFLGPSRSLPNKIGKRTNGMTVGFKASYRRRNVEMNGNTYST